VGNHAAPYADMGVSSPSGDVGRRGSLFTPLNW
jgi:hypothetical protein